MAGFISGGREVLLSLFSAASVVSSNLDYHNIWRQLIYGMKWQSLLWGRQLRHLPA